jgi:3-oxoacyl-[acyl-carrier-protein] synthase II
MTDRALVTGIGSVSCFGVGVHALMNAVSSGSSGVAPIARFDTSTCRSHRAALIRDFDPTAFVPPLRLRRIDAVGRVAIASAKLALDDAGLLPDSSREELGVALGTFTAGLDSLVEYLDGLTSLGPTGVPAILFSNTVANAPASLAAIEFGLRGPNITFNQREASGLAALAYAFGAVRHGRTSTMLAGASDCIEETFFKVHDRFRALAPRHGNDEASRPFARARDGFVLGEGGCLLVVESASAAERRGARAYGEILGIGAASAAASRNGWPEDSRSIAAAMRLALEDAQLTPNEVHALFAAANGSRELDRIEAAAIAEVFGAGAVPVASIKGAIGESSVAAASSIAAGLLALPSGVLPPTSGCSGADAALCVRAGDRAQPVAGSTFLVNSVASGGSIYSVVARGTARPGA